MASPVGHLLAGQLAYRAGSAATGRSRAELGVWCAVSAVAPDLDFIPGILLGYPALYHQGASHSLLAALVVSAALAAAYAARTRQGFASAWLPIALAYLSHLGLDLLGPDRRPPYGIPLLWPFSDAAYLAPVTLLPGVRHAASTGVPTTGWLARTLSLENARTLLVEALLLGPLVLVAELTIRRRRRASDPARKAV